MTRLMPDTQAPELSVALVGGGAWDLAAQTPRNFTMIVVYRGYHCPVCKAYLEKMENLVERYQAAGFSVIAVSMDTADRAAATVEEWGLRKTPIGYGLSEAVARQWGLYISKAIKDTEADIFAEPGLFWVRPDGRLYMIDISNMPWPRPDLEFLHSKIPVAVDNAYPARGTYTG